ncbi:hypothetical protein RYX45_23990, partial [Alkalihalophilus pseudofirmus]
VSFGVEITSGTWEFFYTPEVDYIKYCSTQIPIAELVSNENANKVLAELAPQAAAFPAEMMEKFGHQSLRELSHLPFLPIPEKV